MANRNLATVSDGEKAKARIAANRQMADISEAWSRFTEWAYENSVDSGGHPDDWGPWWDCYCAGWHESRKVEKP